MADWQEKKLPLIHINLRQLHDRLDATAQEMMEEDMESLTSFLHKLPDGYLYELRHKGDEFVLETFTSDRTEPFKIVLNVDDSLTFIEKHGLEEFVSLATKQMEKGIREMYLSNHEESTQEASQ